MSKPKRAFLSLMDEEFWGLVEDSEIQKKKDRWDTIEEDEDMEKFEIIIKEDEYDEQAKRTGNVSDNRNPFLNDVNQEAFDLSMGDKIGENKQNETVESKNEGDEDQIQIRRSIIVDEIKKKDKRISNEDNDSDLAICEVKDNEVCKLSDEKEINSSYDVKAFLNGPFHILGESFFHYYEKVRKRLEDDCASKIVQQLKRPTSCAEQRFRDKSFVVVSHFREPDRRMGRFSKYYYHHNIGPEVYSRKVFVGGLPSCVSEEEITQFFSRFGKLHVDWPSKHYSTKSDSSFVDYDENQEIEIEAKRRPQHIGYVFLLFEKERSVRDLVSNCFEEEEGLFITLLNCGGCDSIRVQIRPWLLADAEFLMDFNVPINTKLVAFIGGVPRPLKAVELAHFFEQTYGNVVCVGIDIDNKFKYPRGSGRVAFSNYEAYVQAITDRYIVLDHEDIHKRVEMKPYFFHNQSCEECSGRYHRQHAPFFCPSLECFQYYCEQCWHKMHSLPNRFHHMPVVKGV